MLRGCVGFECALLEFLKLPDRLSGTILSLSLSLEVAVFVLVEPIMDTLILRVDTSGMQVRGGHCGLFLGVSLHSFHDLRALSWLNRRLLGERRGCGLGVKLVREAGVVNFEVFGLELLIG